MQHTVNRINSSPNALELSALQSDFVHGRLLLMQDTDLRLGTSGQDLGSGIRNADTDDSQNVMETFLYSKIHFLYFLQRYFQFFQKIIEKVPSCNVEESFKKS